VSKLTTDVVTYCTEASNQKSKYAYRKKMFYKKALSVSPVQEKNNVQTRGGGGRLPQCLATTLIQLTVIDMHSYYSAAPVELHATPKHSTVLQLLTTQLTPYQYVNDAVNKSTRLATVRTWLGTDADY